MIEWRKRVHMTRPLDERDATFLEGLNAFSVEVDDGVLHESIRIDAGPLEGGVDVWVRPREVRRYEERGFRRVAE